MAPTFTTRYVPPHRVRINLLLSAPAQYRDVPGRWEVLRDGKPMSDKFDTRVEAEAFAQSQREWCGDYQD